METLWSLTQARSLAAQSGKPELYKSDKGLVAKFGRKSYLCPFPSEAASILAEFGDGRDLEALDPVPKKPSVSGEGPKEVRKVRRTAGAGRKPVPKASEGEDRGEED